MIGSSSGAAVHLAAALGIPWLPQTYLIPVRWTGIHPDEPRRALEAGIPIGRALLRNNPEIELHHMHDPNQDRLMIRHMAYFRVKRIRLGHIFERFLRDRLEEGATIYLLEDGYSWPKTRVPERHYFQMGASGGITAEEYINGSERVQAFLEREGLHRRLWDAPGPNCEGPEAEWGYAENLRDELADLAATRGFRLVRVAYRKPGPLSPLVADLYRWWYNRNQSLADRPLVIHSFILMNPW